MSLSVHLVLGCVVCIVTVVLYRDQLLQVIYLFILPTLDISYITARPGVGKLFSEGPHYYAQNLKGPECA